LCPRRDAKENQVTQRIVNQMLTEMDGLDSRRELFIVAATNRPDIIDPAILRPGRLDKLIYISLPSPTDRLQILQACAKNTPFADDVNLDEIAADVSCTGYSGADLALVHREAQSECIKQAIEKGEALMVTQQHYHAALSHVLPSVTQKDERRYEYLHKNIKQQRTRTDTEVESATPTGSL